MRLGLLSDTHDRVDAMRAGLRALHTRSVDFIVHCGDVGSEPCLDLMAGFPTAFVWGNNDWDRATLTRYATTLGLTCYGNFGDFTLDNKRIALMHGDDFSLRQRVLDAATHDYLFQGHTHVPADERIGTTRVINPGALYRASEKTVAVLDLSSGELEFLRVDVPARRPA